VRCSGTPPSNSSRKRRSLLGTAVQVPVAQVAGPDDHGMSERVVRRLMIGDRWPGFGDRERTARRRPAATGHGEAGGQRDLAAQRPGL
jgi:hypothetical protein